MAGYSIIDGMSNNALKAYREGKKPISKFTAADFKPLGLTKADAMALVDYAWQPCEWHHSGGKGFFNKTNFYDIKDLAKVLKNDSQYCQRLIDSSRQFRKNTLKAKKEQSEKPKKLSRRKNVYGFYYEWVGSARYRRKVQTWFTGTVKDGKITTHEGVNKLTSGNNIEFKTGKPPESWVGWKKIKK